MIFGRLLVTLFASALFLVGVAGADGVQLRGSVGSGFTIALADASGARVTKLDAGAFSLTVDDKSEEHNFHLQGPGGVDVSTEVEAVGEKTFSLTLVNGKYTFICDPHSDRMFGSFTVGEEPAPPPTVKPPTVTPVPLVLTLTAKAVGLTTPAGRPVRALAAGPVAITVRDRSAARAVRLSGAGVRRSTGARFVGTAVWRLKLSAGTLVVGSDARKPVLRVVRVTVR